MGPLKLAVVGGGPSAFYVASRILSRIPHSHPQGPQLRVHLYDRLWAPHGLVRYGVAPDHPEVKNCVHKFDETATDDRFRFFGNVNVGAVGPASPNALALPLESLYRNYSHLLLANGCTVPVSHPSIPPEPQCIPALSLVHWYTAHPSSPNPPPLDKIKHVTIVGQGNVSLDVARILLTSPDVLAKYDVPEHVLAVLRRSTVEHVSIVGRRGPFQAAFTTKELREMMALPEAAMVPLDAALLAAPADTPLTRQQTRTLQLLQKGSVNKHGTTRKTWSLDFFRAPTGLAPPAAPFAGPARLALAHTALDADGRAVPTEGTSAVETDLVVTSLGYRGAPLDAYHDARLGHVRHVDGRVVGARNVYASGWAAMGARGVLASTMLDAHRVVDTMLDDWVRAEGPSEDAVNVMARGEGLALDGMPEEVRDARVTTYEDWKLVDVEEVRRGEARGKERERMDYEEAVRFLAHARAGVI